MTLRDHFAGLAMQALIANPQIPGTFNPNAVAQSAYVMADSMLEARK